MSPEPLTRPAAPTTGDSLTASVVALGTEPGAISVFGAWSSASLAAAAICFVGATIYLAASYRTAGTLAFPLDDAWIHQTYARTFAHYGEWGYRPGIASSGSTAPLWTLLLAAGYWLPIPAAFWTYGIGIVSTLAAVFLGGRVSYALFRDRRLALWSMAALAAEWHLLWAAISGMEIALYNALALLLLWLWLDGRGKPWIWGVVGGLLTLTRPEGLWLAGLICLAWAWERRGNPGGLAAGITEYGAGLLAVVAPVLYFNVLVSGQPFPNTFYAKQQEYGSLLAQPLWKRARDVLIPPLLGGQTFLLAALPVIRWRRWSVRQWLPLIWAGGLVIVYAMRLPVSYQHGRYLMPIIPVVILYGVAAFRALLSRLPRLWSRPLALSVAAAFGLFALLGALRYAEDVAIIECEMGGAASWLQENAEPGALIAAHDIGKVGYFTPNPILDFAGLISPETIPILRDDGALLSLATDRGASYLVTFADWYPQMVQDPRLTPLYASDCPPTLAAGREPMTVYGLPNR